MSRLAISIVTPLLCGVSLAASAPQGTTPLPGYRYELLWSPSGIHTRAYGISEAGEVAGASFGAGVQHGATIWTSIGPRRLGMFGSNVTLAKDIDSTGMVVGSAVQGPLGFRSFRWQAGVHEILTVQGFDQVSLVAVSESGEIVGTVVIDGSYRAAHWVSSSQGALIPLPTTTASHAFGVNEAGTIVGRLHTTSMEDRGFIHSNGVTTIVEPLVGDNHTGLSDINNSGVAVGYSTVALGHGHMNAILVSNGAVRAIPMPSGAGEHVAWKINNRGQVIGLTEHEPFLYQDGETWLLRDLAGVPQWNYPTATDINERGQIVGWRHDGTTYQGFVLTPCLGNLNRDPVIDDEDFDLFYRAYQAGAELADVDENGIVDANDELVFLQAWNNGC